jgi:tetratricopeptide (TPR) repeat protein
MIYIGGTDPGRFIPTLLNETADGERHIIVTQNALADQTYLDYVSFLYSDRFTALTKEESERAFQDYLSDAQKRLQHDQQFPNEPKQIRPGEDLQMIDNRLQVSGQIAVMAINEKLLQTLMEKNPDASFAMEESFPFNSMFANASSLGPIMELRVRDEQNVLTRERAAQSVDYWRTTAQQIFADPEARESPEVLKSYSKLISSQGGLFANRNYTAEAEQAFRLAAEICPYSSEAVFRLANLLVGQNRIEDALPVAEAAVKADMNNQQQFRSLVEELNRLRKK